MGDDDMVHEVNLLESIIEEHSEFSLPTNPSEPNLSAEEIAFSESDKVNSFSLWMNADELGLGSATMVNIENDKTNSEFLPPEAHTEDLFKSCFAHFNFDEFDIEQSILEVNNIMEFNPSMGGYFESSFSAPVVPKVPIPIPPPSSDEVSPLALVSPPPLFSILVEDDQDEPILSKHNV